MNASGYTSLGGLALTGHPCMKGYDPVITLTATGFTVYYKVISSSNSVATNKTESTYYYLAFFF